MGAQLLDPPALANSRSRYNGETKGSFDKGQGRADFRRSISLDLDPRMPAGLPQPPDSLLCPVSRCLLTEPVTLLNTGVTLQRASAQKWYRTRSQYCPVTGELISGWAVLQSNDDLRELVELWASRQGVNKEALHRAGDSVQRSASTSS